MTKQKLLYVAAFLGTALATVLVFLLLQNIFTRQREAEQIVFKLVDLNDTVVDPAIWGKNYPRQYDAYLRTSDMVGTRYGGSEALPGQNLSRSRLEADKRLVTMWAGYAFSIDYRERRGHAFMLADQRATERVTKRPQPGACLHCHGSVTVAYREAGLKLGAPGDIKVPLLSDAGKEQLMKGFAAVSAMPYAEATKLVTHPVACIDCHDPNTMNLRVTRPGFLSGIQRLAESKDPVPHLPSVERWRTGARKQGYDPNTDATRQEMRSFVCGQCHVEYYFRNPKDQNLLTYPWHNGLKVEQIQAYYDQKDFVNKDGSTGAFFDWKHQLTGAPALKAQHPEFELWSQGIHARAGVACADCHMPYKREGAIKISDHHVRSPLLMINQACQTCHRVPENELKARAEKIQDRTKELMDRALDSLMALIADLEAAQKAGAPADRLEAARNFQRLAQFRVDFINAENSMGFHAGQESARILGEAIDFARQGQLVLVKGP